MRDESSAAMGLPHFPFASGEIETLFLVLSQALDLARDASAHDSDGPVNDN